MNPLTAARIKRVRTVGLRGEGRGEGQGGWKRSEEAGGELEVRRLFRSAAEPATEHPAVLGVVGLERGPQLDCAGMVGIADPAERLSQIAAEPQ